MQFPEGALTKLERFGSDRAICVLVLEFSSFDPVTNDEAHLDLYESEGLSMVSWLLSLRQRRDAQAMTR